jgi:E3 Ubiquitin ligase
MPLKSSDKSFLKGAFAGAAVMDFRKSCIFFVFGFFFLLSAIFMSLSVIFAPEISGTLAQLSLQTPEEVEGQSGLVKIQGTPVSEETLLDPITQTPVLYYHLTESHYMLQAVEKTRTIQEESKTYTETYTDYEAQWVLVKDEEVWADFSLGSIKVSPDDAEVLANPTVLHEAETQEDVDLTQAEEDLVNVPQKKQVTLEAILPDETLIVVGLLSQNQIQSGKEGVFVISNKTNDQLIEDQRLEEENMEKAGFLGIWFFLTFGLFLLTIPFLRILNIMPGLGVLAGVVVLIAIGIVTGVCVFVAYLGFEYWWILLSALVLALGLGFYSKVRSSDSLANQNKPV